MQAHRSHFYQRAVDSGFGVSRIVARVFIVNIALCALAAVTLVSHARLLHWAMLAIGGLLVAGLLANFASGFRTKT